MYEFTDVRTGRKLQRDLKPGKCLAAAMISSRKVAKGCFRRLAVVSSLPQLSAGSTGSCHSVEMFVRKICAQSAWQLQRRGAEDVRRGRVDLRDGSSGQHRWYARSNSEKAKPDPDVIATEMLKYAASCRNQETFHVEALRVLEQGKVYLLSEGSSAAPAYGHVLLTVAIFYVDSGRFGSLSGTLPAPTPRRTSSKVRT